jgi:hypothetical protein
MRKIRKVIIFSFVLLSLVFCSIRSEEIRIFFPKINKLQHLYCIKVNRNIVPEAEQLLIVTLQGVVNRKQPSIFILENNPNAEKDSVEYWLEEISKKI